MLHFFYDYAFFILQFFTIILFFLVLFFVFVKGFMGSQDDADDQRFEVSLQNINEKQQALIDMIEIDLLDENDGKKLKKEKKKLEKQKTVSQKRFFVLDFEGDVEASAVEALRREISILLAIAKPEDEVILCLNNSGGYVHTHGLAASQLQRLKDQAIPLTICVDMVAASGGYMMACVANQIIAAPFALIGSIGVVAQMPNFHKLLKQFNIDYDILTAGKYKRTMTMLGENTEEGKQKLIDELQMTHTLFKDFILHQRTNLSSEQLDALATGETWYGTQAIKLGLIDEVATSDQYILSKIKEGQVFKLKVIEHKSLKEKIRVGLQHSLQLLMKPKI